MDALFQPESIAVVGASQTEGKLGNAIVRRVIADFKGKVFPINPSASEVAGIAAYPDIASLPQPVDLLIALLPGTSLLPIVESCTLGQVCFLLAIPSGFGEVSDEGRQLQDAIVSAARARGMRVVGPNCMGLLNGVRRLNASLVPEMPPAGEGFSFVTQSGGFGIAATMYASDHQLPIAKICDLGNTADVQAWEVMRHLRDDADTKVAGILLEATGVEERFLSALSELASAKPTIVTLLGRTEAGKRASRAHLGLDSDSGLTERLGSTGAIRARTGRDLFNFAKAMMWQPKAPGKRLAIVTGTGGVGSELADLAVESGLEVPPLTDAVTSVVAENLPAYAGLANPVDLTPIYLQYAEVYPKVVRSLLAADNIDLVIVSLTDVATGVDELALALVEMEQERASRGDRRKPVLVFWGACDGVLSNMRVLEAAGIPCFRTTSEVVAAAVALTLEPPGS